MIDPDVKRAHDFFAAIRAKCFEVLGCGPDVAAERGIAPSESARLAEIDELARRGMEIGK